MDPTNSMVDVLLDRLLSNLELELAAFAVCELAPGWRLRLAELDWVSVHFVIAGMGRLRTARGRTLALPAGSLAVVPPSRAHALETGGHIEHEAAASRPRRHADDALDVFTAGPRSGEELLVVWGRLQARYRGEVGLFDALREPLVLDFDDSPQMASVFERLLAEQRAETAASGPMMRALMAEALILLFRRLCDEPDCPLPWLTSLEDQRFARALSAMLEHPERDHSLVSLADLASMSRSAFAQSFKRRYGMGPMTFLREARLHRAAELLRAGHRTVESVASGVGYASRSQFTRAFQARYGVSPAAYRGAPASDVPRPRDAAG